MCYDNRYRNLALMHGLHYWRYEAENGLTSALGTKVRGNHFLYASAVPFHSFFSFFSFHTHCLTIMDDVTTNPNHPMGCAGWRANRDWNGESGRHCRTGDAQLPPRRQRHSHLDIRYRCIRSRESTIALKIPQPRPSEYLSSRQRKKSYVLPHEYCSAILCMP